MNGMKAEWEHTKGLLAQVGVVPTDEDERMWYIGFMAGVAASMQHEIENLKDQIKHAQRISHH